MSNYLYFRFYLINTSGTLPFQHYIISPEKVNFILLKNKSNCFSRKTPNISFERFIFVTLNYF